MFSSSLKKRLSFTQTEETKATDSVFLVRGADTSGEHAWYYVLVDKNKRAMFKAQSGTDMLDITKFGKVLHSGYGEQPPEHIKKQMLEEYKFSS